jgi:pyruvate dehydrogenase E1 component
VLENEGTERAHFLLEKLIDKARRSGRLPAVQRQHGLPQHHPADREEPYPGDRRWSAASAPSSAGTPWRWWSRPTAIRAELGGHIASFASAATLYDVGFNHFFRAPSDSHGGDLVFFQGHSAPGIYARAFLEGRLSEEQLHNFRQEVEGKGLSSYPHPG